MSQVQTEWDLSQERAFMESLLCQRFNFFIVIFSLVIAGAASTDTQPKLDAILWLGFVLCTLVGLTVYRVYVKLILILRCLHQVPQHPVALIGRQVRGLGWRGLFGVNPLIGVAVPIFCCLVLLAGAILASSSVLLAK